MATDNPAEPTPPDLTEDVLEDLVSEFKQQIKESAIRIARQQGVEVSADHVRAAYRRHVKSPKSPRSQAQRIIAQAFRDNRHLEIAAFTMALALFVFGVVILGYGVFASSETGERIASIMGGSMLQVLVLFPLRITVKTRQQNLAIRIFGYLVDKIEKPEVIAALFRQLLGGRTALGTESPA
jgi:hypothetical protein